MSASGAAGRLAILRVAILVVVGCLPVVSGCVTKENYTAQVNRTTNLQRLLAEEEKRSADLAAEIARLKKQGGDLEVQNKALTTQLTDTRAQIVRSLEEVGRLQDEIQRARKGSHSPGESVRGKSATAPAPMEPPDRLGEISGESPAGRRSKGGPPPPELVSPPPPVAPSKPSVAGPAPVEPPDRLGELQGGSPDGKKAATNASSADADQAFRYHVVKKGESLSSIARLYKTDLKTLRELNDISGSDIRIGDRLIVGKKEP